MNIITYTKLPLKTFRLAGIALSALFALGALHAQAAVNPFLPFYGSGGTITANPSYPIVGENTHLTVQVGNSGDQPATNVRVKVSFNDWGITFMGWQEIGTVVIPSIPAGGTATAETDYIFQHRTHTCLEALIVGANQDDDLNDDRGQINLEVINAGETFSYNVPVRNEGDQPLQLLLLGRCKDAAGAAPHKCADLAKQVDLQPGQEVLVPINLDLHALAPGQAIDFVVDAFDINAASPFAPAHHNYIELHLVRQTASNLKAEALATLALVRDQTTNRSLRNRLDAAANQIALALNPRFWLDGSRVRHGEGAAVFAAEKVAVQQLLKLLGTDLTLAAKANLNEVLLKLTDADRILAETANQDAGVNTAASELIGEGDAERIDGEYSEAIQKYFKAWQEAGQHDGHH
jgi:hypothetical protein